MARERLLLTLPEGMTAEIDAAAGGVPRVRWIEDAIRAKLSPSLVQRSPVVTEPRVVASRPFKCPSAGCVFRSGSDRVTCPIHGYRAR